MEGQGGEAMRTPEQNREYIRAWRAANPARAKLHQDKLNERRKADRRALKALRLEVQLLKAWLAAAELALAISNGRTVATFGPLKARARA